MRKILERGVGYVMLTVALSAFGAGSLFGWAVTDASSIEELPTIAGFATFRCDPMLGMCDVQVNVPTGPGKGYVYFIQGGLLTERRPWHVVLGKSERLYEPAPVPRRKRGQGGL